MKLFVVTYWSQHPSINDCQGNRQSWIGEAENDLFALDKAKLVANANGEIYFRHDRTREATEQESKNYHEAQRVLRKRKIRQQVDAWSKEDQQEARKYLYELQIRDNWEINAKRDSQPEILKIFKEKGEAAATKAIYDAYKPDMTMVQAFLMMKRDCKGMTLEQAIQDVA